jgi:FkbM family methyltransferase
MRASSVKWSEHISHQFVDTPIERSLDRCRCWLRAMWRPELTSVFLVEPVAIHAVLSGYVKDGMRCVDVGAHIGSVTAVLWRLSPAGRHIAVEPTPHKAAWLRRKFPDVDVVECALGERTGTVDFYYQPAASGYSSLRPKAWRRAPQVLEVSLCRLDDIIPAGRRVDVLKVDVEGGELGVFRGATRVLEKDRPWIVFECTETGLEAFQQTPAEMHAFLTARGYEIFTPIDRLQGRPPLDPQAFQGATRYPFRAFNFIAVPTARVPHGASIGPMSASPSA